MKIYRKPLVTFLLSLLVLSGCGTKSAEEQSEQASVSSAAEVTQDIQSGTVQQEEEMFPENQEYFQAEYDEAVKQRDISQEIEYTPVESSREVKYGNLPQNLTNDILPGLVCPDIENGILYFSNLSDGETLCKLEDGIITELLPVSAKSINLWDGYLYYICDTDNMVGFPKYKGQFRIYYTGDIYRYNIATGENELLIEADAYKLIVSEYGLDYSAGENYSCDKYTFGTSQRYYHADFDGKNITECDEFPIIDSWLGLYYGDYRIEPTDGAFNLQNMQSSECTPIISRSETLDCAAIVGDILYYCPNFKNYRLNESGNIVSKNMLCGINLASGEQLTVGKMSYMTDYAVIGDTAYMCGGLDFSVFRDGKQTSKTLELHGFNDASHEFIALYTDGENLYAADDRKGIYVVEENEYGTGLRYYDIGGEPWGKGE